MTREDIINNLKELRESDAFMLSPGVEQTFDAAISALEAQPSPIKIGGAGTTHWYECPHCGRAVDPPVGCVSKKTLTEYLQEQYSHNLKYLDDDFNRGAANALSMMMARFGEREKT